MFKNLLTLLAFALLSGSLYAQVSISGTVTDAETGETLPSVNILITELSRGAATDVDGNYTVNNVPSGTYTVRATFVGYQTYSATLQVDNQNVDFDIALESDLIGLDDVVVTAFGVSREEKSLGYNVQSIKGEQLDKVDNPNIVTALAGKVAGIQVIGTPGSNIGGSEKIRIRGSNGLSDGQPLFVVDGTPITNDNSSLLRNDPSDNLSKAGRGRDYGNLAQDINLSNVEDISVLKGAAAASLYGNRASNGVIFITTSKSKMGVQPIKVDFSNRTTFEIVYLLPEYQNEYAGGYNQDFLKCVDPIDNKTYNCLNYAADESRGPRMDGTLYRPWWSWFDADFDGDGVSDYGKEIPLTANPNNVKNFYDTGTRITNNIAISGGATNTAYRVSLNNSQVNGVIPGSELETTKLGFNGSLNHNDRFTSSISFNYANTQGENRPSQGYSPDDGNPSQSFNQWFQRQLDMDKLQTYVTPQGIASWNIRSHTNLSPLYWDSPYFTLNENFNNDDRDRLFGNYRLSYDVNKNINVIARIGLDTYDMTMESGRGSGGLELDNYSISQRTNREINYELTTNFEYDFSDVSIRGLVGGNVRYEEYSRVTQSTSGGLSTPNFFNIEASIDRPNATNYKYEKQVNSIYINSTLGYKDILYLDATARNDWSSVLPEDNNSYFYWSTSTSLVFTEFSVFDNLNFLSFGKLRASYGQVGADLEPYQIMKTYVTGVPYGSKPGQAVPNRLQNSSLEAAIKTTVEFGVDLRFLDGRLRTDINYYQEVDEDQILSLSVPGSSGYEETIINAGKFTTTGWEVVLGATPIQTRDWNVDFTVNFQAYEAMVDELADGIDAYELEDAYFGLDLFVETGKEWGILKTDGYYGFEKINGQRVVGSNGTWVRKPDAEFGSISPDWTGGFIADVNYKNFALSAAIDFQSGGLFHSISRQFTNYSGLGRETVGNNSLGNPIRDPIVDKDGNPLNTVLIQNAGSKSGGINVKGVDSDGNPVEYLTEQHTHFLQEFFIKEANIFDASYIKLREVKISYHFPSKVLSSTPIKKLALSVDFINPLLLYSTKSGIDPSNIQNGINGFSFWEGGATPNTRGVGFNVNLGF
jgi:TonB-linked SusC/RagA family outer membrane protein